MKPNEARALRLAMQQAGKQRRDELERVLKTGAVEGVVPELIPTAADHAEAVRELREALAQADRAPRGPRRDRKMDKALRVVQRVIWMERVLALDPLDRASLTPSRLSVMAVVTRRDLQRWHMQATGAPLVLVPGEERR